MQILPQILPLPAPLSDAQQQLRQTLPTKPAPVVLSGRFVRMEPYVAARDAASLYAISNGSPVTIGDRSVAAYDADALVWRFMGMGPFANLDEFQDFMQRQVDAADGLPFTVFDSASNQPVGAFNLMSNSPANLKIELGNIWYTPAVHRTAINSEATYLALKHCFELGYRRVEWKCNSLNERSRQAALRMGFQFEGIQESHMIIKNRNRDTAWFRILAHEWQQVKAHLEALLAR